MTPPPLQQPIGVNQRHRYTVLSVEWNSIRLGGHVHVTTYCTQKCAGGTGGFWSTLGWVTPRDPHIPRHGLNFLDVTFYQETAYELLSFLQYSIRCCHAKKIFIKTTIKSLPDCHFLHEWDHLVSSNWQYLEVNDVKITLGLLWVNHYNSYTYCRCQIRRHFPLFDVFNRLPKL